MEEWKPVLGYEGYYEVSNIGNVRAVERTITKRDGNVFTRKAKDKVQHMSKDGYMIVKLSKNGVDKNIGVHRLVALSFVSGYYEGAEVNHKDFNRANNKAENLEWVSHKNNIDYTIKHNRHISQTDLTGSNNPNYNNHTLANKYKENKILSKEKQSRPGAKNGRARKIRMIFDKTYIDFDYIGACARYLIDNKITKSKNINNIVTHISESAKNNKTYCDINFKFL